MNSFSQYMNQMKRSGFMRHCRRMYPRAIIATICALLIVPAVLAGSHKKKPYRHSHVDIPVSLAVGTVRTPEFATVPLWYDIMVQVEKPLSFSKMMCMMGVTMSSLNLKECNSDDPVLRADWTVWDGDHIVDKGTIPNRCACKFEDKYIYKFLGGFGGEAGKKYVVEVKFTKDGTALNVANPHLIVIQHRFN